MLSFYTVQEQTCTKGGLVKSGQGPGHGTGTSRVKPGPGRGRNERILSKTYGDIKGKTGTGTRRKNIKQDRRSKQDRYSIDNVDYIVYIIETRPSQENL